MKSFLKSLLPAPVWQALKWQKAKQVKPIFAAAEPETSPLPFAMIAELNARFPAVADYLYDDASCRQRGQERAKVIICQLGKPADASTTVVELGCSDGFTSHIIAERGFKAIAVDIVDQRKTPADSKAGFVQAAAEHLPFENNSVDALFSYNSMEHFLKPEDVIKEITRVLKPGGLLYLDFDPLYYSPRGLHAYRHINIPYCQILFALEDLQTFVKLAGLEWSEIPYTNGYTAEQFRAIWKSLDADFTIIKYQEEIDLSGLELIKTFPGQFRKSGLDFENFMISRMVLSARKR